MVNKYYRLENSADPNVIGRVNGIQSEGSIQSVHSDHPMLSRNIYFKKIDDIDAVITVKPVLGKRAKLTDLISAASSGIQLMVSDKLKRILESGEKDNVQFFPMSVIYKDIELKNYWLTNTYHFSQEYIDYEKSDCQFRNSYDSTKNHIVDINSYEEFEQMRKSLIWPESVSVKNLVMCKGYRDLVVLRWVYGGVGYYVSERLKYEMEEAECTGIVFEEAEMSERVVDDREIKR